MSHFTLSDKISRDWTSAIGHLFVVTYGRTGSTALQNVLNSIPDFLIRGESGGALNHLAKSIMSIENGQNSQRRTDNPAHPWFGIGDVNLQNYRAELVDSFSRIILRPSADTRMTGLKDIRFTTEHLNDDEFAKTLSFLRAFPGCRIVFLTRDPVAVAQSGWWAKRSKDEVIPILEATIARFQSHIADDTFLIDHSEFDGRLDGYLKLIDWLGESPPGNLRDIAQTKLSHMKGWKHRYFAR